MQPFTSLLDEIRKTLMGFYLFNNILTCIVVFLVSYLLLSILTFHPYYAFIPAVMYLIISTYVRAKGNMVAEVERKYAGLDEKLRTAAQYLRYSNPVIDDLKTQVVSQMHTVKSSSFFHTRRTTTKVSLAVLLCFLIILSSHFDKHFFDLKYGIQQQLDKIPEIVKKAADRLAPEDDTPRLFDEDGQAGNLANRDIYGDKSLAELGDDVVNMEMHSLNFRLSLKEEQELVSDEFEDSFPSDIYAEGASTFKETIAVSDQEVVKKYFKSLTNTRG